MPNAGFGVWVSKCYAICNVRASCITYCVINPLRNFAPLYHSYVWIYPTLTDSTRPKSDFVASLRHNRLADDNFQNPALAICNGGVV